MRVHPATPMMRHPATPLTTLATDARGSHRCAPASCSAITPARFLPFTTEVGLQHVCRPVGITLDRAQAYSTSAVSAARTLPRCWSITVSGEPGTESGKLGGIAAQLMRGAASEVAP